MRIDLLGLLNYNVAVGANNCRRAKRGANKLTVAFATFHFKNSLKITCN